MRVALYARNSKPPKGWRPAFPGEEPPGSWRQQLEELRAWAAREGHEVVLEAYDAKVSGKNPNRPGWRQVMQAARGHHVHEIAAVKLDRVMRSAGHFYDLVRELTELTVDLCFTAQGLRIGKANPMTKALIGFLALMADLERDWAFERQAAVMEVREDGRLYGPRSELPAGRPREFGPEHKHRRRRDGSMEHDRARCRACRGENGGVESPVSDTQETGGLGEPDGFPAPGGSA